MVGKLVVQPTAKPVEPVVNQTILRRFVAVNTKATNENMAHFKGHEDEGSDSKDKDGYTFVV